MNENIFKTRIKVLEKLFVSGYNTDKKILDMKIEEIICLDNFNRSDLTIAVGIKNSLCNKQLITFLCGNELKGGEK